MTQVSEEPVSTMKSKVCVPKVTGVANSSPSKRESRPVLWFAVGITACPRRKAAERGL